MVYFSDKGYSVSAVCRALGVSRSRYYRAVSSAKIHICTYNLLNFLVMTVWVHPA
ncbi:helix-turn-helix domain-containing protein [bacterium]|nr:helix-turn-helix domain-containing protein [bacterium]